MPDRMPTEPYEVYAVRYAHLDRPARDNFIFGDIHDGPMPLDFFVWAIVGNGRTFVVDLGFDHIGRPAPGAGDHAPAVRRTADARHRCEPRSRTSS